MGTLEAMKEIARDFRDVVADYKQRAGSEAQMSVSESKELHNMEAEIADLVAKLEREVNANPFLNPPVMREMRQTRAALTDTLCRLRVRRNEIIPREEEKKFTPQEARLISAMMEDNGDAQLPVLGGFRQILQSSG